MIVPNAQVLLLESPAITLFAVEPGDATLYTVYRTEEFTAAHSGPPDYLLKYPQQVAVVDDWGIVKARPKCSNSYQEEILLYLAHRAMDLGYPDPRVYRGGATHD